MIRRIGRTVVIGTTGGPPISLFLAWLAGKPLVTDPLWVWLYRSVFIGLVFALSFSLLCGPPVGYVLRRLRDVSIWKLRCAILMTAFAGGSLAITIVGAVLSWTLNLHFGGAVAFEKWVLIDGVLAAALGLILLSHDRLKAERDAEAARAESAALTAQIRPHFLFNTLNTISAQITHDPAGAQENLGRLGDMFRYTMKHARQDTVPLCDEIDMAHEYLLLEKARFGDRLQFTLPEPADTRLPGLTLQPLVENAVRHGVAKRADGGCVTVSVEYTGEKRILKVRNPVLGNGTLSENQLFREGHALWILRKRLPGLKARQGTDWFEVEVPLP
jgi:hypothetical protein